MIEQLILYQGCSSGLFEYETFVQFMEGRGQRIPMENDSLQRMEIYVLEPATTLIYRARKRIVPRGLDLWSVAVSISGYGVGDVERRITKARGDFSDAAIFKQKS